VLLLLQVVPYTLAENAGLNPIQMVTELRAMHGKGVSGAGINVRRYHDHRYRYYSYCDQLCYSNWKQPLFIW
jgi:chaperonin GroEL (HSP60 family)